MNDIIYLLKSKKIFFIILALGIILMAVSHFGSGNSALSAIGFTVLRSDDSSDAISNEALEEKITSMLKNAYSLESVSVIITYDTAGEKIIEQNHTRQTQTVDDSLYASLGKQDAEPFVKAEKLPGVRGAMICAYPLNEAESYDIKNAVSTLLGVSVNKVSVIYKK